MRRKRSLGFHIFVIPAKAGTQLVGIAWVGLGRWVPAFAEMTGGVARHDVVLAASFHRSIEKKRDPGSSPRRRVLKLTHPATPSRG